MKWNYIFNNCTLTVNRTLQRIAEKSRDGNRESKVIEQFLKTKISIKTIPIPQNILLRLKDHNINQNKYKLKLREAYFNNYYIFCYRSAYPIDSKRPARNLKSILTKINIESIKFLRLIHTYATRLFEDNVPPKTVHVLMVHSDISITLDIYTYVMEDIKLEAEKN